MITLRTRPPRKNSAPRLDSESITSVKSGIAAPPLPHDLTRRRGPARVADDGMEHVAGLHVLRDRVGERRLLVGHQPTLPTRPNPASRPAVTLRRRGRGTRNRCEARDRDARARRCSRARTRGGRRRLPSQTSWTSCSEAERLGYHHVTCSEHVAIPTAVAEVRGGRYWDPLATFGYLAALTSTIRLATHVLVLGYHHPLEIAKRYGTLDVVSDGRLILGVGVGSLEEEFDLLGAPFADRGARADDAMRALRAALSEREPEYHGAVFDFSGMLVDPCAVQAHVPMWVGGRTARSLRRAVELGDGWAPFGLRTAEIAAMLARARDTEAWAARRTPIEIVLQNERPLDPLGEPTRVAGAGPEDCSTRERPRSTSRFVHHSPAHYKEQLAALRTIV